MNIFEAIIEDVFEYFNKKSITSTSATTVQELINNSRISHGLNSLVLNPMLISSATKFAFDAYNHNLQSHTGSDGSTPGSRIKAEGYRYSWEGECMAVASSPREAFNLMINEPLHYEIIMNVNFTEIGVGVYNNRYVVDFGRQL